MLESQSRRSAFAGALIFAAAIATAQVPVELYGGMKYREIGPFRGGRSCAVSGVPGKPTDFYMGTVGGGLWKSNDTGENWRPISDGYFMTGSVGAIGVAPSQPETVYVGMGETDIRGNISHGDGVYKSTDGGATWKHAGLKETQFIGKVRVHPTDPNTVYVAALGPVYGPSKDRGVYKTTDGGATWRKILFMNERAGAINLVISPDNPEILYASTWESWRTPYTLNSGGPGSKLWKSTDGGDSWTDISRREGLPIGILGKIGIAVSPKNPKRVWAMVEALDGGLFRSDDAGQTWTKLNADRNWRQRAWYYTHVIADPNNADICYVLNVGMGKSTDGGTTLRGFRGTHSDNHDMWIDPADSKRIAIANDGGVSVTVDGGQVWSEQDYATAQMYHVSVDNAFPYNILGAQQDNSTVRIPSRTRGAGITREDWTGTAGGESGYVSAKPNNPNIVFGGSYGGDLSWIDHLTNISRSVDPWPDNPMGSGAGVLTHRFQWTFPIVWSPHDPELVYTSSQHLMKSRDLGQTWDIISPDLTRNDNSKMGPSGGPITGDNTSVEYYGTIFTVAESPKKRNRIWTGSDDGLVHVTDDGGKSWLNVTPKGMPEWGLVSMVEASPHSADRAWLAVDNHENNDFRPYIYRTDDRGKTWVRADKGIPMTTFVRCVREDTVNPNLVFAATEMGMFVSFDAGKNWQPLALNLPVVPVHDCVIKNGDLVLGTHGRSFWVLDDISPLRALAAKPAAAANAIFFPTADASRGRWGSSPSRDQDGQPVGANPLSGVIFNYFLPKDAEKVTIVIQTAKGETIATLTGSSKAGFNRTNAPSLQKASWKSVPGFVFWGAFPQPIPMPPGTYRATLEVDGQKMEQTFRWMKDPRSTSTDAELVEGHELAKMVAKMTDDANNAVLAIRRLREQIKDRAAQQATLAPDANALIKTLTDIEETLHQPKIQSGQDPLNYPIRLNNKMAALLGQLTGEFGPTRSTKLVYADLSTKIIAELKKLDDLQKTPLADFNKKVTNLGLSPVSSKG